MTKYENKELCSECGGICCKAMGCHFSPDDFESITYETLKNKIDEGYISIDWWEGDPTDNNILDRAYILRIRNVSAPIVDPSFGGICSLLTSSGCPFPFKERPKGARALIPSSEGCILEYTKRQCAIDWIPYTNILERLYQEYESALNEQDVWKFFLNQLSE